MNIIFDAYLQPGLDDRYIVLELDTFRFIGTDRQSIAYCLLEKIALQDILQLEQWCDLHDKLMKNYRLRNWNFCTQALEHLVGRWQGELDSFYQNLKQRVDEYQQQEPGEDWTGTLLKVS